MGNTGRANLMVETRIVLVLGEGALHSTTGSCKGFPHASPAPIMEVEPWEKRDERSVNGCS